MAPMAHADAPVDDGLPPTESRGLVERVQAGDAQALEELLAMHMPRLRAFVRVRLGPRLAARESASDVVQSACRDVLGRLDSFRYGGEAGFRAWLYAAAARKVADRAEYWGAQRRDPGREAGDIDALSLAARTLGSPSAAAMGREALQRLDAALDSLPDDHREVIVLARVAGLSRAQIAEAMERSEASIRNLLPRALARLAEALHEDG